MSASMLAAATTGALGTALNAKEIQPLETDRMSKPVRAAWENYLAAIESTRQYLYSRRFIEFDSVRHQANQLLMQAQAAAYNWVMAPRVDYPRFYVNTIFEPMVGTWLGPCPDFIYRWAFVDGTQTYRIWGKRSNSRFLDIQLGSWFGAVDYSQYKKLPTFPYPIDNMQLEPDGSFEIIASPDPQKGNWIKLDPAQDRMYLFVREGLHDWEHETRSLLRIERQAKSPPRQIQYNEEDFVKYLNHASRFINIIIKDLGVDAFDFALNSAGGRTNTFTYAHSSPSSGGNRNAAYCNMVYDLTPDQAMIIEFDPPTSKYWGFCLMDRFLCTTDFTYHQSSLNKHQARIDKDGKYRYVLTKNDPGIPNWLDPVDVLPIGYLLFRQYFQDSPIAIPSVKIVKFEDIRKNLPTDTPAVSAAERSKQLHERSWQMLAQYGY